LNSVADGTANPRLAPGTLLRAVHWINTADAYPSTITVMTYYDSTVYEPVSVVLDGIGKPTTGEASVISDYSVFDDPSTAANTHTLLNDGFVADFEWNVAYPPSIQEMLDWDATTDSSKDEWLYGAGEVFKYYPAAWFDKATSDVDYPGGAYDEGEFALPLAA
jgi:hypothetical protein